MYVLHFGMFLFRILANINKAYFNEMKDSTEKNERDNNIK